MALFLWPAFPFDTLGTSDSSRVSPSCPLRSNSVRTGGEIVATPTATVIPLAAAFLTINPAQKANTDGQRLKFVSVFTGETINEGTAPRRRVQLAADNSFEAADWARSAISSTPICLLHPLLSPVTRWTC